MSHSLTPPPSTGPGARVRFVAEDGEVLMRTGSLSHEERVAVARFVLRLERA